MLTRTLLYLIYYFELDLDGYLASLILQIYHKYMSESIIKNDSMICVIYISKLF